MATAKERAERGWEADRENRRLAYEDLAFAIGEGHWTPEDRAKRDAAGRPALVVNRMGQFVRQVTGDIRQMRPAMKCIGVDDGSDQATAEIMGHVLRYIEARSDATDAYYKAVDSQATCGIGHWRVETEYADDESDVQDIRICSMDDQVGVVWDPDAKHPNKADADWCFVYVDKTMGRFKEEYPDSKATNFDNAADYYSSFGSEGESWDAGECVRIAEYFVREKVLIPNEPGSTSKRKRYKIKVVRYLITSCEVLEGPEEVPGIYIPIVHVPGEQIKVGQRTYRHGLIRFLKDAQIRYNYFVTAQAEMAMLQPKSPFLVTTANISRYQDIWASANEDNLPYLPYDPDPLNSGQLPSRVQPPVSSPAFNDNLTLAAADMQAIVGIYDASLGARSNETSGVAIDKRERQGDTGTAVYTDNFLRAIKHTGRICVGMIPTVYDTARTLRIIGEDGAVDEIKINQRELKDGEETDVNDVTIGKYDVVTESGPSFATKREAAKDAMMQLVQAQPAMFPLIGDLIVKAMDMPLGDKIAERLRTTLPPEIRQREDDEAGDKMGKPAAPPVPPPQVIAQQVEQEIMQSIEGQMKQADLAIKSAQARKAEADASRAEFEAQSAIQAGMMPPAEPLPVDPMGGFEAEFAKTRAMKELDFEFETRRKRLERDSQQTKEVGLGHEAAEQTEEGPTPVQMLQGAIMQQGDAVRDGLGQVGQGLAMLAQSMAAPKRVVRDEQNRVVGVEGVA